MTWKNRGRWWVWAKKSPSVSLVETICCFHPHKWIRPSCAHAMVIPLPGRLGQSNTAQFIHVNIDTGNRKTWMQTLLLHINWTQSISAMLCWIVVQACKVNSRILLFTVRRKVERNYFSSTQPEHWIRILEEADSSFKTKVGRMILVSSSFRTPSKLVRDAHNFINVLMDGGWHHIIELRCLN